MKKSALALYAMLPLALPPSGIAPIPVRAYQPRVDGPSRLAPNENVERSMLRIAEVPSARSRVTPWSDRNWDHNRALLGERYTDSQFLAVKGWSNRKAYNEQYSAEAALALPPGHSLQRTWLASLSPAEKYDVIMGTVRGGLYDEMSRGLDRDMDESGRFPNWWGICEGSAAASLAEPEPVSTVWVRSEAYGVDVPFYATDVKGLASMLWSSYNRKLRLPEMGQQCQEASRLGANTQNPACFDVNPGSFQIALHHFLGRGNGSLIVDIDASRTVWNHPVLGYDMSFFRPGQSGEKRDFRAALRPVSESGGDPRRDLRARGTAYLVGVNLTLIYGENQKQTPKEGSLARRPREMKLRYELELDESYRVLGGEWLVDKHPDLLWTIPSDLRPDTAGDRLLGEGRWTGRTAPIAWTDAAYRAAKGGVPLRRVVEGLVRRSTGGEGETREGGGYEMSSRPQWPERYYR